MGFVRRGGGGGGGGDDGGGDSEVGSSIKRCSVCRRELLPWEDVCPDDGGPAILPEQLGADHDALLARILAEGDDAAGDGEAADGGEDAAGDDDAAADDSDGEDEPHWPAG